MEKGPKNQDEEVDGMPTRKRRTHNTAPLETTISKQSKKTGCKKVTLHIEQGSSKLTVKMPFNCHTSSENESEREKVKKKDSEAVSEDKNWIKKEREG